MQLVSGPAILIGPILFHEVLSEVWNDTFNKMEVHEI